MQAANNILSIALNDSPLKSEMELVQHNSQDIPGSVQYIINRYRKSPDVEIEETGMLNYYYSENENERHLELVFCMQGNRYCKKKDAECNFCQHNQTNHCTELVNSIDVACFRFNADHLSLFVKNLKTTTFSERVLSFK